MWSKLDPGWELIIGVLVTAAGIGLTALTSGSVFSWIVLIFVGAFIAGQGLYRITRRP